MRTTILAGLLVAVLGAISTAMADTGDRENARLDRWGEANDTHLDHRADRAEAAGWTTGRCRQINQPIDPHAKFI